MKNKESIGQRIVTYFLFGFIFLVFSTMITTCSFHDEMKYKNIKEIKTKMVVSNEIYKMEGRHNEETVFYLRVKSPFIVTPEPDYLIPSTSCPTARINDTLVCLVSTSDSLRNAWYSFLCPLAESNEQHFRLNQGLFEIEEVVKVIKGK